MHLPQMSWVTKRTQVYQQARSLSLAIAAGVTNPGRPQDPLEVEAERVLHLPAAVALGLQRGSTEQCAIGRHVGIGPHQRVGQVVRLKPEFELVALLDRERLGNGPVEV